MNLILQTFCRYLDWRGWYVWKEKEEVKLELQIDLDMLLMKRFRYRYFT